jgi:hypothetical protein
MSSERWSSKRCRSISLANRLPNNNFLSADRPRRLTARVSGLIGCGPTVGNTGGSAGVNSVSCAAVSRCGAGGRHLDSAQHFHAFVTES